MAEIIVGCCGWAGSQAEYFELFPAVEVQQTFYKPPQPATLRRWAEKAPEGFVFTLKAWQLITHPPSSPTYRKAGIELSPEAREQYGFFRPTPQVFEAWEAVCQAAHLLGAKVVVFQCPASFAPTPANKANLCHFFRALGPQPFALGWEPRGSWPPGEIKELCDQLGLIHVVDPFQSQPLSGGTVYYRLHGISGYRYRYSDEDLQRLLAMCPPGRQVFVMFNNVYMREDARRFQALVAAR
jgi:uncharacterized protein YecE (DUF72 family)